MAPGDVIEGKFGDQAEAAQADNTSAPRLVDFKKLAEDLQSLAKNDVTVFHFQTLANLSQGRDVHNVHESVLQKLEPFLDEEGRILPEVSTLLNNLYPSQQDLYRDQPNLARRYATDFNRKANASDIPEQEQRWAFIRNAQAVLDSYQPAGAEIDEQAPTVTRAVA